MTRLNIDLRFAITQAEVMAVRRHVQTAAARIQNIGPRVREEVLSELKRSGNYENEEEVDIAYKEIYFLEDELPRFELYATLLVLYASFESTADHLLGFIRDHGRDVPSIGRTKGDNFVQRWFRLMRRELDWDLASPKEHEILDELAELRNAIAHANGVLSRVNRRARHKLASATTRSHGLTVEQGRMSFDPSYLSEAAEIVEAVLDRHIEAAKKTFRSRRNVGD